MPHPRVYQRDGLLAWVELWLDDEELTAKGVKLSYAQKARAGRRAKGNCATPL